MPVLVFVPVLASVPVPASVSSLPSLVPGSSMGTTLSDRRRVLRPKLVATCKRHLLSSVPRAELQCLVFYYIYFLMRWILESPQRPPSLSIIISILASAAALISVPAPVPVPVLRLFSFLRSRPRSRLVYITVPVPDPDPVPVPARSFPSLIRGYPFSTMHLHRQRALRTELLGARKRHSLFAEMMARAE